MSKIFLAIPEKHSLDALYPPIGLLCLATVARENGHKVIVIDGQIVGDNEILQEFGKDEYDYFGTTILTPLREASYDLIRKIKKLRPQCIIIAGGAHVSILPYQTMIHVPEIDVIVIGEGEQTVADILSGKKSEDILGIWYRDSGTIKHTKLREPMDPKLIPMPAWDLIDITRYKAYEENTIDGISYANKPFITIITSRGCTGSCSFCSTWSVWRKWRQRPVNNVIDEIEYVYKKGISHFFIADDSMINDDEFVTQFANELLKRNIKIKYKIACRADKINQTIINALKMSGCYEIHIGFESGSQKILDSIGKKLSVSDNINAAKLVHDAGINVYALMVIGSIDETIDTINETIDFLKIMQPDEIASMAGLMILPGTRDCNTATKEGFISEDYWLSDHHFPFYTKNFSLEELQLIYLFVRNKRKIWKKGLLFIQSFLFFPKEFINIYKRKVFYMIKREGEYTLNQIP